MRRSSALRSTVIATAMILAGYGSQALAQSPGPPPGTPEAGANPFESAPPPGGGTPGTAVPAAARALLADPEPVKQLYQFRYREDKRWDGETVVLRKKLSYEEAQAFDRDRIRLYEDAAKAGDLPNYPGPGTDARVWAEWSLYTEQLALWVDYCKRTLFTDEQPQSDLHSIKFPGDPKAGDKTQQEQQDALQNPRGGAENVVRRGNNGSGDVDGDLKNIFASKNEGGGAQTVTFTPRDMDRQVAMLFSGWSDQVIEIQKKQNDRMLEFNTHLNERAARRDAYAEWRKDQQVQLDDIVKDWSRRYDGSVSEIEGVRYELYKPGEVPRSVPRGSTVVESNAALTPYDILDDKGQVKKPAME